MGKGKRNGISPLENDKISSQVGMATCEEYDKISSQVAMATGKEQGKISSQLGMATGKVNASFLQNLAQMLFCVSFFNKLGNKMRVSISFFNGMGKGSRNRISLLENNKISSQLGIYEQEKLINEQEENKENNVAELQTKVVSFANERELLDQKNRELSIEVVSLKSLLNQHNAKLAHLKDEMDQNASVLEKYRTEKTDLQSELNESKERIQTLLTKIATKENTINRLQQLMIEGVEQRVDLIEQHKVTEHSLRQRNEILQEEVDRTGRLLDAQNQRVEELKSALHSVRSLMLENGKSRSNGSLENGKPKSNGPLEKDKPKPNHVNEMVTFFNSQGTR